MSHLREMAANVAFLAAGGVIGKALRFLAAVRLANVLGADSFGGLAAALGAASVAAVACDLGLSQLATREMSRDPGARPGIAANVALLKLAILACVCGPAALCAWLLPLGAGTRSLALAAVVLVPAQEVAFEWLFEGSGRMGLLALYRAGMNCLFLAAVLLFVRGPDDAAGALLLDAGSSAAAFALSMGLWPGVWRYARGRSVPSGWGRLLRSGLPFASANMLVLSLPFLGVFVLAGLKGPAEAGLYRAAGTVVFGLLSAGFLVSRGAYPVLSKLSADPKAAAAALAPLTRTVLALALPAAAGLSLLAGPLTALLFKQEYAASATVLAMLAWSIPLGIVAMVLQYALMAFGRARARSAILAAQAALELGLAAALVPRFSATGAAAAHLAGEAFAAAASILAARRAMPVSLAGHAVAPALSCLVLAAAVLATKELPVPVPVVSGATAYFASLGAIGLARRKAPCETP